MAKQALHLHPKLDDVLVELISNASEFRDESIPKYLHAVNAIQALSVQLQTLRKNPSISDDCDLDHGSLFSGPIPGCHLPVVRLRSHEERRGGCLSLPATATSVASPGVANDVCSPMSIDFDSGHWSEGGNQQFLTFCDPAIRAFDTEMVTDHTATAVCESTNSPPHRQVTQRTPTSVFVQQAEDITPSVADVNPDEWLDQSHNMSEDDMNGNEAQELLNIYVNEQVLDNSGEVPAESWSIVRADNHADVYVDDIYPARLQPIADVNITQTFTNIDAHPPNLTEAGIEACENHSITDEPENQQQHSQKSSDDDTRQPKPKQDKRVPADIVNMPISRDCSIEPEAVYELIKSHCKNSSPSSANLRSLTRLFFGLGGLHAWDEFRDVCLSERNDLRFTSHDLSTSECLDLISQAGKLSGEASSARRIGFARVREIHEITVKKIQAEMGLKSPLTASTPAFERMIKEKFPNLSQGDTFYKETFNKLKSMNSEGRHWLELANRTLLGYSLLRLSPQKGPHAVADKKFAVMPLW